MQTPPASLYWVEVLYRVLIGGRRGVAVQNDTASIGNFIFGFAWYPIAMEITGSALWLTFSIIFFFFFNIHIYNYKVKVLKKHLPPHSFSLFEVLN